VVAATKTDLKHTKLLNTVVRSRKIFRDSLGSGQSVFEFSDYKARNEILGLRDELIII